ncbi:hypothetical protein [Schaalia cardiffensis]|uniref:hypothetical protein n=1 Tax=Schaalia cardiffensis TaxID=181487 RepID=UPI0023F47D5C|nr:hypothetical protein [Schaalia cardiffensis]
MILDEFMDWLHEDRNNWVRTPPGELYNRLEIENRGLIKHCAPLYAIYTPKETSR